MQSLVRPELPTASRARVRGMRHARAAVDNSAPSIRPESTYKSGKVVQTSEATSQGTEQTAGVKAELAGKEPVRSDQNVFHCEHI